MQQVCNEYLKYTIDLRQPEIIISVGRYTEDRVKALVKQNLLDPTRIQLKCIPHSSPRSLNITNSNETATRWLEEHHIMPFLKAA